MEPLLVVLFGLGVGLGLLIKAFRPTKPQPQPQRRRRTNDNLDTVDQMFLYGEVTGDDFYRM